MTEKKRNICENRISVSFPKETYQALCKFAEKNRVSVAWVVREAAVHYLREEKGIGQVK